MAAIKGNNKYYRRLSIGYNGDRDFFPGVVLPFKKYVSSVYSSLGYPMPYPDDFFKVRTACAHDCWRCDYCRKILQEADTAGDRP